MLQSFQMCFFRLLPFCVILLISCEKREVDNSIQSSKTDRSKLEKGPPQEMSAAEVSKRKGHKSPYDQVKVFREEITQMNFEELEELLRNPTDLQKDKQYSNMIMESIFTRLAEIDPQRALTLVSLESLSKQNGALGVIFEQWAKDDFETAYAEAKLLETAATRKTALINSLSSLADTDPSRAFELALNDESIDFYHNILTKWATQSPLEAFEKTYLLAQDKKEVFRKAIIKNMQSDIFQRLSFNHQDKFKELFLALDDTAIREVALKIISDNINKGWNKTNKLLEELTPYLSETELASVSKGALPVEAKTNPLAYGEGLLENAVATENWEGVTEFFEYYGKRNPAEAITLAEQIESESAKGKALSNIMNQWAWRDGDAALDYVLNNLSRQKAYQNISNIGFAVGRSMPRQAIEKVLNHPDNDSPHLGSNILTGWAYNDVEKASAYLKEISPEDPHLEEYYSAVARGFTRYPNTGLDWVSQIENDVHRNAATESLVSSWAHTDIDEPIEWVNQLPASEQRDYAVSGLASSLTHKNPELAMEWADTISDNAKRWTSIKNAYSVWKHKDEDSAKNWLKETTSFTESELEVLSKMNER